jgi:hypothetical protein
MTARAKIPCLENRISATFTTWPVTGDMMMCLLETGDKASGKTFQYGQG